MNLGSNPGQTWSIVVRVICDAAAAVEVNKTVKDALERAVSLTPTEMYPPRPYYKITGAHDIGLCVEPLAAPPSFEDLLSALGRGWHVVAKTAESMSAVINVIGSAWFVAQGTTWASVDLYLAGGPECLGSEKVSG